MLCDLHIRGYRERTTDRALRERINVRTFIVIFHEYNIYSYLGVCILSASIYTRYLHKLKLKLSSQISSVPLEFFREAT